MYRLFRVGITILCLSSSLARAGADPFDLPHYETRYYQLYTDLDREQAREVAAHVTKMAEVYADRTRGFAGTIDRKFPLAVFKRMDDYLATGAPKGTAGVFNGQELIAVAADGELNARTWHTIQHEGFHQFARAVIRGDLPVWVSEGLAEYFGEGVFTGDDLMTGVIPEWRRRRIVKTLDAGKFKSIDRMLDTSLNEWNREMQLANYDQAWSMVHFLAHGDGGKYQPAFVAYMNAIGRNVPRAAAFRQSFGDGGGFEDKWKTYWSSLPENPTDTVYRKATVATLTSFLARATAERQTFESFDAFARAGAGRTLLAPEGDDLPRSLLAQALDDAAGRREQGDAFEIVRAPNEKLPQLVVSARDGANRLVGKFTLRGGHVGRVTVEGSEAPSRSR